MGALACAAGASACMHVPGQQGGQAVSQAEPNNLTGFDVRVTMQ
jgi:hypothetical protein